VQNHPNSRDGANSDGVVRTLQLLRAGSFQFGVFTDHIAAIAPWREPTPLPHAPKSVLGVVSIQGRMLTVMDLATLPGREAAASTNTAPRHLIALRGDEQLALAVDTVGETVELAGADVQPSRENVETFVVGVWHREGADICILDPKELFPTAIQGRERRRRRF
jgi:purine-binding chemotaxis protein CheW